MKFRSVLTAICVLATANLAAAAPFAYVVNSGTRNVSVIDTADNSIKATVALPDTQPTVHPYGYGVAVSASGQYVYVGMHDTNEVAVIDAARNVVVKRIGLGGDQPGGLAVNAAETRLYVTSNKSNTLIVIDITWGAVEVGRVAVDDAAVSNPEGVVLSPAGDKAYVANSLTNKVAEVSLDEANNVYTRTSLTSVGSKPLGLAISSTGSKLYVADAFGAAAVVDTATKAVTSLTVGGGNVSVAIRPDDSKVFAPSNSLDKIYVIDGAANTVSGTQYPAVADPEFKGPWGSAVAPNNYLYLAMNLSDRLAVFNTADNTFGTPVTLPVGAKPTSFGDFIGPVFTKTITSTNGANCAILPLGAVAVNSYGRTFSIAPISGTCDVKVDGISVGSPSAYAFTGVTADHTIDASQIAGTFWTVTADWISSVGGYLVSTPAGINNVSKSASFADASTVTLKCSTGSSAKSGSWTGACAGTSGGTCTLSALAANATVGVTCNSSLGTGPVYNVTKSSYHQTCGEAVAAAATGDVIKISNAYTSGLTTAGTAAYVTLGNNWDSGFTTQSGAVSMGALTITNVGIIADNLTI